MKIRYLMKAVLTVSLAFSFTQAHAEENEALVKQHQKILRQFSDVSHISTEDLANSLAEDIIIFDVRKRPEYDVSHMSGAIHVDPNISETDFVSKYGDLTRGKTAVFYCSVGVRSSILADKVQAVLAEEGSPAVYNLEGGLFKWHNESRLLETVSIQTSLKQTTPYVHPYNRRWGRMVNDKSLTRYKNEAP